jgi:hypothetical protein
VGEEGEQGKGEGSLSISLSHYSNTQHTMWHAGGSFILTAKAMPVSLSSPGYRIPHGSVAWSCTRWKIAAIVFDRAVNGTC